LKKDDLAHRYGGTGGSNSLLQALYIELYHFFGALFRHCFSPPLFLDFSHPKGYKYTLPLAKSDILKEQ